MLTNPSCPKKPKRKEIKAELKAQEAMNTDNYNSISFMFVTHLLPYHAYIPQAL